MKFASPSRSWLANAMLALPLVASPASAQPTFVIVPPECVQFWPASTWDELLSFAACGQDGTVRQIQSANQLDGFLDELDTALLPTLQLYFAALRDGPRPIKLRAAFQMAMTQVAVMTRARLSVVHALREALEPKLEPAANHAWKLFVTIDEAATDQPAFAPDVVTQHMLRTSRVYAAALDASWHFTRERAPVLVHERRAPCPDFTSSIPTSR